MRGRQHLKAVAVAIGVLEQETVEVPSSRDGGGRKFVCLAEKS
jgi:hypothetical protein